MSSVLISSALGLTVGLILALTGAGGGILAVPLLVYGAHLSLPQAAPIALLAVGMAAALGAALGLRAGVVRYKASLLIAATGMALAPLGLWLAQQIDNRWLGALFAAVLLLVAYRTFRQSRDLLARERQVDAPDEACVRDAAHGRFIWTTRCARALSMAGALGGLLSGLLGVGGGFVLVPALQRFTDLDIRSIIATSLAVIALISLSGVVTSAFAGTLYWGVAVPFTAGALAGMFGGRLIAPRVAGRHLQAGFALVAAAVAVGMLVDSVLF
jgi:hypothetical protein